MMRARMRSVGMRLNVLRFPADMLGTLAPTDNETGFYWLQDETWFGFKYWQFCEWAVVRPAPDNVDWHGFKYWQFTVGHVSALGTSVCVFVDNSCWPATVKHNKINILWLTSLCDVSLLLLFVAPVRMGMVIVQSSGTRSRAKVRINYAVCGLV